MKETAGAAEKDGKFCCDGCGSNIEQEGSTTCIGHADAKDTYSWMFQCNKCGNKIIQTFERDEESKKLWR